MQVTVNDSILRLGVAISNGRLDVNQTLLLGIGTLLAAPKMQVGELGKLTAISYEKDGEGFTHEFRRKPVLAYTTTQLLVLGGKYNIRPGIGVVEIEDIKQKT